MLGLGDTTDHKGEVSEGNLKEISKLFKLVDLLSILESSFTSWIEELNQMFATHIAHLIDSIVPKSNTMINHLQFGGLTS